MPRTEIGRCSSLSVSRRRRSQLLHPHRKPTGGPKPDPCGLATEPHLARASDFIETGGAELRITACGSAARRWLRRMIHFRATCLARRATNERLRAGRLHPAVIRTTLYLPAPSPDWDVDDP